MIAAAVPDTSLVGIIEEYRRVMRVKWTPATQSKHRTDFDRFLRWLDENRIPKTLQALTSDVLHQYQLDLVERVAVRLAWRGNSGPVTPVRRTTDPREALSTNTVSSYLSPIRALCTWLVEEGELLRSPFWAGKGRVRLSQVEGEVKAATEHEVSKLEDGTRGRSALMVRDRAIFRVLRWTAIRADELCGIRLADVDIQAGTLFVMGKGRKGRTVPLPEPAVQAILRYMRSARKRLLRHYTVRGFEGLTLPDPGWLFLSKTNGRGNGTQRLTPNAIGQILTGAHKRAGGVGPSGPHGLRHFRAAELIAGGMSVAMLQLILGHSNITTTQRYLRSLGIQALVDATIKADHANLNTNALYQVAASRRHR